MLRTSGIHYETPNARGRSAAGDSERSTRGEGSGVGRRDRSTARSAEDPPAVPRVGPRAEHRIQLLVGAQCLEDLELLRNDEVYLDALGAQRIPDPTTAGDFCRRFAASDVERLMEAIASARARVWARQPDAFSRRRGSTWTARSCRPRRSARRGWTSRTRGRGGFHPLLISLANTQEPLLIENRSGNRPSHENASARIDQAVCWCREAGFRRVRVRGDTDFTQTRHLERGRAWSFSSGSTRCPTSYRSPKVCSRAGGSGCSARRSTSAAAPSAHGRLASRIRSCAIAGFRTSACARNVADCAYRPTACKQNYRLVIVRKNLSVERANTRCSTTCGTSST
jgi:hypothetical protein